MEVRNTGIYIFLRLPLEDFEIIGKAGKIVRLVKVINLYNKRFILSLRKIIKANIVFITRIKIFHVIK